MKPNNKIVGSGNAALASNFREDLDSFIVSLGRSGEGTIAVDKEFGNVVLDEFYRKDGFVGAAMSPFLVKEFSLLVKNDDSNFLLILEYGSRIRYAVGIVNSSEESLARKWICEVNALISRERTPPQMPKQKRSSGVFSVKGFRN